MTFIPKHNASLTCYYFNILQHEMLNKVYNVDDSSLFWCFFEALRQVLHGFCMITIQMRAHENLKKSKFNKYKH